MKTVATPKVSRMLELAILILLILPPLLPWFRNYDATNGPGVSLWSMVGSDIIDLIGNLTYDRMTLTQVLQAGYLTSVIIELTYLACTWGYIIVQLIGRKPPVLSLGLLCGGLIFMAWVGLMNHQALAWGYWASIAILLGGVSLQARQSLRTNPSLPLAG